MVLDDLTPRDDEDAYYREHPRPAARGSASNHYPPRSEPIHDQAGRPLSNLPKLTWFNVATPFSGDGSSLHQVIRSLSEAMHRRGDNPVVVCADNRPNTFPNATKIEVDFRRHVPYEYLTNRQMRTDHLRGALGLRRNWSERLYRPAVDALREANGPILVHKGHLGEDVAVELRRAGVSAPIYLYFHTQLSKGYTRRELSAAFGAANGVVCVSNALEDQIGEHVGAAWEQIPHVAVPNAIDHSLYHPPSPAQQQATSGHDPEVLFVGAMQAYKGPQLLVDALLALDHGTRFQASFVGSQEHGNASSLSDFERGLRERARPLGSKVSFVPYRPSDEVPDVYRSADILVIPSQIFDACPLVLFEGMASGLAVLATRQGGIPEIGGDAIQYFDTPEQLSAKLSDLISHPELRTEWGEKARVRSQQFTWDRSLDTLAEFVAATAPGIGSTAG